MKWAAPQCASVMTKKFKRKAVRLLTWPVRVVVWPYLWCYVRKRRGWGHYPSCRLDQWLVRKGHVAYVKGSLPWEKKPEEREPNE